MVKYRLWLEKPALNLFFRVWLSLVERLNGVQEAAGSTPVTRTKSSCFLNKSFLILVALRRYCRKVRFIFLTGGTARGSVLGKNCNTLQGAIPLLLRHKLI